MESNFVKVSDLRPETSGHNLKLKVIDFLEKSGKADKGKSNQQAEILVGDETASIIIKVKNEQGLLSINFSKNSIKCFDMRAVEVLKSSEDFIVHNARIEMLRGSMRLSVPNMADVKKAEGKHSFKANKEVNMSLVEFELVPVNLTKQAN